MNERYWTVEKVKRMIDRQVTMERRECIDLPDGTCRVLPWEVVRFTDSLIIEMLNDKTLFNTGERAELLEYYLDHLK